MKTILNLSLAALGLFSSLSAATSIYEENFENATLPISTQATLGFFNSNLVFGEIAVSSDASIQDLNGNQALRLTSQTNGEFRGIGIALNSSMLAGAGTYSLGVDLLTFDLSSSFGSDRDDSLLVNIFSGNGFVDNTNNGLVVNGQTADLMPIIGGNATSQLLGTGSISFQDSPNTGALDVQFNYNGTDEAVVIYIGALSDGFPFPEIVIDNIVLSTDAVPEPSSFLYLAMFAFAGIARRTRK